MESKQIPCIQLVKNKPGDDKITSMLQLLHYWLVMQDGCAVCTDFSAWVKSIFGHVKEWGITAENHRGVFLCTHRESVLAESFLQFLVSQADSAHMKSLQAQGFKGLNPFAIIGFLFFRSGNAGKKADGGSFVWYTGREMHVCKLSAFNAPRPDNFFGSDEWCKTHLSFSFTEALTNTGLTTFVTRWKSEPVDAARIRLAYAFSRHPPPTRRKSKKRGNEEEDMDFSASDDNLEEEQSSSEDGHGTSPRRAGGTRLVSTDARSHSDRLKRMRRANADKEFQAVRWLALTRLVQQAGGASAPKSVPTAPVTVHDQKALIRAHIEQLKKKKASPGNDASIAIMQEMLKGSPEDISTRLRALSGGQEDVSHVGGPPAAAPLHRDVIEGFDPNGLTLADQVSVAVAIMQNLKKHSSRAHYPEALEQLGLVAAPPPPPPPPVPVQRPPSPPNHAEVDPAALAACQGALGPLKYLCEQFRAVIQALPIPVEPDVVVEGQAPKPPKPPPMRNVVCTYDPPSEVPRVLCKLLETIKPKFTSENEIFQLVSHGFCFCDFLIWLFLRRMAKIGGKQSDALGPKAVTALMHMQKTTLPIIRVAGYEYLESGGLFDPLSGRFQPLPQCLSFIRATADGAFKSDEYHDKVVDAQENERCSPALAHRLVFELLSSTSDVFKEWNQGMTKNQEVTAWYRNRDLGVTPGPVVAALLPPADSVLAGLVVPEGYDGIMPDDLEGDCIMLHAPTMEEFFQSLDPSRTSVQLYPPLGGMPTRLPRAR